MRKNLFPLVCYLAVMTLGVASVGYGDGSSDKVQQSGTNLYWLRCPVGQSWNGASCTGSAKTMAWGEANSACPSGYRLPTRQEFANMLGGCDSNVSSEQSGYCKKCSESRACKSMFGSDTEWYWSSSPVADDDGDAWDVGFSLGLVGIYSVDSYFSARCVR